MLFFKLNVITVKILLWMLILFMGNLKFRNNWMVFCFVLDFFNNLFKSFVRFFLEVRRKVCFSIKLDWRCCNVFTVFFIILVIRESGLIWNCVMIDGKLCIDNFLNLSVIDCGRNVFFKRFVKFENFIVGICRILLFIILDIILYFRNYVRFCCNGFNDEVSFLWFFFGFLYVSDRDRKFLLVNIWRILSELWVYLFKLV